MTFQLARVRGPIRVLLTGFLLTAALGLGVSALQVQDSIGLTPDAIATAVAGPESAPAMDDDAALFSDAPPAGKSYASMLQTAHTHTLAMPMLYVLLGAIFVGTALTDRTKSVLLALAFVSIVADLGGLWLIRYVSRGFTYWNMASGTALLSLGGFFIARSLWDLWLATPAAPPDA